MRKASYNGSENGSVNRTITMASNIKFQNVERLNTIVGQITQRTNVTNSNKVGMSSQVLDMIKNRIKSNYDKLYENYDDNKQVILKKIHEVETNMSSENTINKGFQNFIKEKSAYDKAKIELQVKQKKLNKLIDIKEQLKTQTQENGQMSGVLMQKCTLVHNLEDYKQSLDYQTFILSNMRNQRRQIKLFLTQKYDRTLLQEQNKKQKIKKLQNSNHNKKAILKRIEQTLKKEQMCQIPENLAEELQRKLSEYEGKHVYQNIIKHQGILSEQNRRKQQIQLSKMRQQIRKQKLLKQKQDKKEYELAYNFYLIKQQEEEKIKKICGVSTISEIANNTLQTDSENLLSIKIQIQRSIAETNRQNAKINEEIEFILTMNQSKNNDQKNLLNLEEQLVKEEKQLRLLEINSHKKYEVMNTWQSILQLMSSKQVRRTDIAERCKQILERLSKNKQFSLNSINNLNQGQKPSLSQLISTKQVHTKKFVRVIQQTQSQCSIINNL